MSDDWFGLFTLAVMDGDEATVRRIVTEHPTMFSDSKIAIEYYLEMAAMHDDVAMCRTLTEAGADFRRRGPYPDTIIFHAAGNGAVNAVRWLLSQGATINRVADGARRCPSLATAAREGHLEVVKILVEEAGADVNAFVGPNTILSHVLMYGQTEVADYLRSKGARETHQLGVATEIRAVDPVVAHMVKHFGKVQPLAMREILPTEPSVAIHAIRTAEKLVLFTNGMSSLPQTVPPDQIDQTAFRYAELLMLLPPDWPTGPKEMESPEQFWPYEWMRRIALFPHQQETWLTGPSFVFANNDPPQPLAPHLKMTCMLGVISSRWGKFHHPDGRDIVFFTLFPLHTEEYDLSLRDGVDALMNRFLQSQIPLVVDPLRSSVLTSS